MAAVTAALASSIRGPPWAPMTWAKSSPARRSKSGFKDPPSGVIAFNHKGPMMVVRLNLMNGITRRAGNEHRLISVQSWMESQVIRRPPWRAINMAPSAN